MSPRKKKDAPADDEVVRDAEGDPVEDPTLSGILPPIPEADSGGTSTFVSPQGDDQPTVVAREWRPPSPHEEADEPAEPEQLEPAPLGEPAEEEPPPAPESPEPEPEPVAVEPEPEPEPVAVEPEPEPLPPEPEPEPAAVEPLSEPEPVSETFVEPAYEPAYEPAGADAAPPLSARPEVLIGAAFAGGIVLAILIRRLGR